ncbi:hypothetical protein [Microcoleus sp. Z1_B5]
MLHFEALPVPAVPASPLVTVDRRVASESSDRPVESGNLKG